MKPIYKILPTGLLFISLILLRHQLLLEVQLDYQQAMQYDLYIGWIHDLVGVFLILSLCQFLRSLCFLPQSISWPLFASILWLTTLANVLHFRFFKSRLEWWIVQFHWQDLTMIADSSLVLANTPSIIASAFCFVGALIVAIASRGLSPAKNPKRKTILKWAVVNLMVVFLFTSFVRYRFSTGFARTTFLNNQTLKMWVEEWDENARVLEKANPENTLEWEAQLLQSPTEFLAHYRNYSDAIWNEAPQSKVSNSNPPALDESDLTYDFAPEPQRTEQLRQQFGLPLQGPINVILLFVESWRIFEMEHPEIAPQIFPQLHSILEKKSLYFPQAYTSSLTAGQTVRGQFSTLCSMLPNITGPAVYLAYSNLNIRCLSQLFQENGYQTLWMNTLPSSFHNSDLFESLHGTQKFYDYEYFKEKITQKVGNWGLADEPFLEESLKILETLGESPQPFFANLLTISTHDPYYQVPEGPLSPDLMEAAQHHEKYLGYLSRFRYADKALSHFIQQFLASNLANNTLLVMLGDHSSTLEPHIALSPLQKKELQFRIPLALISKNLKHPMRMPYPVHQIDVAPTIARIAGISGKVTWVGKGLLAGEGSSWVYQDEDGGMFYRTISRGCYQLSPNAPLTCWKTPRHLDLLFPNNRSFSASLPPHLKKEPVAEMTEQTRFFQNVIRANKLAIVLNQVMPAVLQP